MCESVKREERGSIVLLPGRGAGYPMVAPPCGLCVGGEAVQLLFRVASQGSCEC